MTATEAPPTNGLDPTFGSAIDALVAASRGRIHIVSGYRSHEEQQQLWNAAVAKWGAGNANKWVAVPGTSNHERGMAVDLGGDIALAHDLAPQFGLVFPMGWEPWHIEPVHAKDTSHPNAYTDPPPGNVNPTFDNSLNTTPEFQAASIANAMRGALDPTVAGPITDTSTPITNPQDAAAQGQGGSQGGGFSNAVPTGGQGRISPNDLYKRLKAEGFDPVHAAMFVSIAGRESGFNPAAYNGNRSTGDDSHGLFQINLLNGGWGPFLQRHGIDPSSLNTVEGSVRAAKAIFDSSGVSPWGGYKGLAWSNGTNPSVGVSASGGEVSMEALSPFLGQH